ncbi:MAG TPA: hypothetical protein DCY56_06060, partial [Candidatus Omnitrophica bacterium]|nr:hypothetical protein [Candidatus Omnitrophota bacterium]
INNHYFGTNGAEYATIFYDTNNSGYYVDPASTSNFNEIAFAGWLRPSGYNGMYSPTNAAYFYPNNATYGAWRINGTRNGYGGINYNGRTVLMMQDDLIGLYNEAYGRWIVYGYGSNNTTYVPGNLVVSGYLYKNGGGFQIDHPLDPANKVLVHSFVESPDMKNLYDGVVILNDKGESTIQLPDWFGALNKDFRYQLTTIGKPGMPYVKEEIKDNKFTIAGDPGVKVSWQVTGTRHDAYAEKNRIKVEEEKGSKDGHLPKKGEYLAPECYGEKE